MAEQDGHWSTGKAPLARAAPRLITHARGDTIGEATLGSCQPPRSWVQVGLPLGWPRDGDSLAGSESPSHFQLRPHRAVLVYPARSFHPGLIPSALDTLSLQSKANFNKPRPRGQHFSQKHLCSPEMINRISASHPTIRFTSEQLTMGLTLDPDGSGRWPDGPALARSDGGWRMRVDGGKRIEREASGSKTERRGATHCAGPAVTFSRGPKWMAPAPAQLPPNHPQARRPSRGAVESISRRGLGTWPGGKDASTVKWRKFMRH